EQEGQQTETEATGAPQKHHYTLNQQVGSITYFSNMVMLDMYKVECENYRKIFKELEEKTTQIFSYVESDDPTRGRSNEGYFMLKSDIKELVSKGLDHEQKFRNSH
ncbi:hypothetical protein M2086_17015, partial [Klebsiella pneumoniae]|nr:hypothetical protein [Klebsiella pneumoniae]